MKVLKFGGTSVGTPERIKEVVKIVKAQEVPCVVVVSAFQGVTDELKKIAELAASRDKEYRVRLEALITRHFSAKDELIPKAGLTLITDKVVSVFTELKATLEGIFMVKELSAHTLDRVLSTGELISSTILSGLLEDCIYIDAREIIKTDNNYGYASVDFAITNEIIRKRISGDEKFIVVPGFIASNADGDTTTLGRGGSDYTAAIIAAAIDSELLEIWTDVDGFMSADPKNVDKAYAIEYLTYSEAIELSHFGAKVIYTPTLRPVYKKNIPIKVLNSFNPTSKGTIISNKGHNGEGSPIKGISSIDNIDLITLQGTGMVGVSGTSMRLFGALARKNVNIILITQASSEYSITFAVRPADSLVAEKALNDEFRNEIEYNKEIRVQVERNLSIIAIVGERMRNTPGISATLFKSLGRNGINVIATAQGSSELNISVVIRSSDLRKALNVIHDGFFLSSYKEMHLFIVGIGLVGNSFLKQIKKQQSVLFNEHKVKINLIGVTNTRKMLINTNGIKLDNIKDTLNNDGEKADLDLFINKITSLNLRNSVFIDCTADEKVAMKYPEILSRYVSIVTANKIACSADFSYYQNLRRIAAEKGVRLMYETTVGAGLPIIKTINDLVLSGDKILKIEAVLSGTMNFIFNELSSEIPLSTAVKLAREKGYSEPDPRIDLSGTDVVRKILILSREAGYNIEKSDVKVEKFLPDDCFEGDLNEFFNKLKKLDTEFEEKRKNLLKENKKWRFFAKLENGEASVGLVTVDSKHPSYNLEGSNNIVLMTTERYNELPLVIKGYGAGADVTAGGIFADMMRVINV